jgi:hypothetical protein
MDVEERWDPRADPRSALQLTGWLLREDEIQAVITFERNAGGLLLSRELQADPSHQLFNGL